MGRPKTSSGGSVDGRPREGSPSGTDSEAHRGAWCAVCCVLRVAPVTVEMVISLPCPIPGAEQVSLLAMELVTSLFLEPHEG